MTDVVTMEFDRSIQTRWKVALFLAAFSAAFPVFLPAVAFAIGSSSLPLWLFFLGPVWVIALVLSPIFAVLSLLAKEPNAKAAWFAIALSLGTVGYVVLRFE